MEWIPALVVYLFVVGWFVRTGLRHFYPEGSKIDDGAEWMIPIFSVAWPLAVLIYLVHCVVDLFRKPR